MFRSNYQGGAVVEVFSGQGSDPVAKWKRCGGPSAIQKEYNKEVKGFVYNLEGSSQTVKMQLPENGKMSLGLLQRFLVLQVDIPHGKDFSVELVITDSEHLKRRLHLSTVHKELTATLLHARIPFVGLRRNIWSTLCIDLVSFTSELFKGFLTLDGITLFATCKVRRIFTMKTGLAGMSDDVMFQSRDGLMDLIPRSCQFPPDVDHIIQMVNMKSLRKTDMDTAPVDSDTVPDQLDAASSTSYQQTRPQGVLHTASGSKPSVQPPQTGRKSNTTSGRINRSELLISNTGSSFSRANPKVFTESLSTANRSENLSHGEPSLTLHKGTHGRSQPHPPPDKQESKKPGVVSAGRAKSDAVPGRYSKKSITREKRTPPSSRQERRRQPLTPTDKTGHLMSDDFSSSPVKESFISTPTPAESVCGSTRPVLSSDLQVWSSWESNEGSEPQLTLQEEVFIFSSQPHSPRRGQSQDDQEKMEVEDDQEQSKSGRRCEAQPEDDFIGSESDEPANQGHHYQNEMNPLLHSNPREWMDMLSPPILPPCQPRRSGNTWNNWENLVGGGEESVNEEEHEDEYLNLLYDPCLNCYFDPKTGFGSLNESHAQLSLHVTCPGSGRGHRCGRRICNEAGLRLHPGIIASVIFVSVAMVAAAVLIIRKYCFPVNEATYRYSLLRRMEEQSSAVTGEDGDRGPHAAGEESDELALLITPSQLGGRRPDDTRDFHHLTPGVLRVRFLSGAETRCLFCRRYETCSLVLCGCDCHPDNVAYLEQII
ncbi:uncharacterized protein C3orf67 homolog isoform X7 [Scophthalmus maximus]|uniref:uncharacterized protein C3orf67 homolog isoform X7 n=1 Tax=Scophthalmus maximus TaxID=52904 RepID=UPI001FA870A9|nr:uncharacterized protein C3orf67 homolog isoform X7 [Scophthalmus maximus]